jgi:hypothetical protein
LQNRAVAEVRVLLVVLGLEQQQEQAVRVLQTALLVAASLMQAVVVVALSQLTQAGLVGQGAEAQGVMVVLLMELREQLIWVAVAVVGVKVH